MIDFANSAGITDRDRLIANAVAFYEHPWNALNVPSALVCQKAPKNSELNVNSQPNSVIRAIVV